ncbi:MAG: hypothetical protein SNJ74_08330 [Fimbriimonadaceae bacterium]
MRIKSLNDWSMPGGPRKTGFARRLLRRGGRSRIPGVELAIGPEGPLTLDATESDCRALRVRAESRGIPILSTASTMFWTRSLGDLDPGARSQAADDLG